MNLFGVMDVTGSALKAERVRADVVASNMANAETTRMVDGGPYRRQHVVFETAFGDALGGAGLSAASLRSAGQMAFPSAGHPAPGGVSVAGIVSDESAPLQRFEPGHPDADANGYVAYPDINPLTEMVDLMGATRAYGMNASALQAEKNMVGSSLDLMK